MSTTLDQLTSNSEGEEMPDRVIRSSRPTPWVKSQSDQVHMTSQTLAGRSTIKKLRNNH